MVDENKNAVDDDFADDSEFDSADEESTVATPAKKGEDEVKPKAQAAMDLTERRKRQDAERRTAEAMERLAHLEGQVKAMSQTKKPEDKDTWGEFDYSDPSGWMQKNVSRELERVETAKEQRARERQEKEWRDRAISSIEDARDEHEDFEEVYQEYIELEKANPTLAHRVRLKADPAEWAYRYTKRHRSKQGGGEVTKLRQEVEELRAQLESEPPHQKQRKTIAGARGSGKRAHVDETDEEVFNNLFSDRDY